MSFFSFKRKSDASFFVQEHMSDLIKDYKLKKILFEKNGLKEIQIKDLEKETGINYLPILVFENEKNSKTIKNLCHKGIKNNIIDREQKWLGFYLEDMLLKGSLPFIAIKWVDHVKEYGVFAKRKIAKGTYVGEYTGIVTKRKKKMIKKNSYCFEYYIGHEVQTPFTINAKFCGNFTRFVNHSYTPNLVAVPVFFANTMHIVLKAIEDIEVDEELTYDYGLNYWRKRENPV
jgi:uncharacterized protein